jgi:hypothetical protein
MDNTRSSMEDNMKETLEEAFIVNYYQRIDLPTLHYREDRKMSFVYLVTLKRQWY